MITVGSKVKINIDALFDSNFLFLNETEISFIKENKDTVFEVNYDWNEVFPNAEYSYTLNAEELDGTGFEASELILLEENAE